MEDLCFLQRAACLLLCFSFTENWLWKPRKS